MFVKNRTMKLSHLIFLFLLISASSTFSQQLTWAKQFGQGGSQRIVSIAVDNEGNSYSLGHTDAVTTDINPGPGVYNLNNPGAQTGGGNVFLVKLDPEGIFLWGKKLSGYYESTSGVKVVTDENDFIYVLMTSYPSPSVPGFILKKFNTDGAEILSQEMFDQDETSTNYIHAESFTVDASNIYVTGAFTNTVVFDEENPNFTISYEGPGTFVMKLNNSFDILWVKTLTENQSPAQQNEIAISTDGNIILSAPQMQMNEEETGYITTACLYKINSGDSSTMWTRYFEGQVFGTVEVMSGEIVIAGYFGNTIDVDPSTGEHLLTPPEANSSNVYLLWLSEEGEFIDEVAYYFDWNNFMLTNIVKDYDSNYYFTGSFEYEYDVDPGPDEFILTPSQNESLVLKFDDDHLFVSAFDLGDSQVFYINDSAILNDHIYFGGHFTAADFSPAEGEYWLDTTYNGTTASDGYIMKWNPSLPPLGTDNFNYYNEVIAYPNPVTDYLNVELHDYSEKGSIKISDTSGRILFTTSTKESIRLNMESFPSGIYFLEVGGKNGHKEKVVKY
jgi:hypothetical protein